MRRARRTSASGGINPAELCVRVPFLVAIGAKPVSSQRALLLFDVRND
jgi:hypothetical protein